MGLIAQAGLLSGAGGEGECSPLLNLDYNTVTTNFHYYSSYECNFSAHHTHYFAFFLSTTVSVNKYEANPALVPISNTVVVAKDLQNCAMYCS